MLERLKTIGLHDMPVAKMEMLFEQKTVCLHFELYDDLNACYVPLKLKFKGVFSFLLEYPEHLRFDVLGCHSCRVTETTAGKREVLFVLEIDDNVAACNLTIGFMDLEIEGGLSPEAQAHRDAYFEEIARGSKDEG